MEKGKFSQNTTRFKDKSKNVQPVVIKIDLVNSLIGNEEDAAPSVKAVNTGLAGKVSTRTFTSGVDYLYMAKGDGTQGVRGTKSFNENGFIPQYCLPTAAFGNSDKGATLVVTTPTQLYHCANKKYVDDNIEPIIETIGGVVETVTVNGSYGSMIEIPTGALSNVYIQSLEFTALNADGSVAYQDSSNSIEFIDANYNTLTSMSVFAESYIEIPEGAVRMFFNCGEVVSESGVEWDYCAIDMSYTSIIFQVKRGA